MGDSVDISTTKTHTSHLIFCAESKYDFLEVDEGKRCGVIHVADHTVSVGKNVRRAYNQASSWEKL